MSTPRMDLNRRTFLKGAAGSTAAMVVAGANTRDLLAQEEGDPLLDGYTFFNSGQVEAVEAFAEQVWPTTDDSIGGRDAGVAFYIDRALSGAYMEYQPVYMQGLDWLNQAANDQYGGTFADLEGEQQFAFLQEHLGYPEDTTVTGTPIADASPASQNLEVEGMPLPGEQATPTGGNIDAAPETVAGVPMIAGGDPPQIGTLSDFLDIMLTHTIEGLFADPAYGGNRNADVWRSLQYGGPYYVHTEEQQTSFEPLDLPVQTIADL